MLFRNFRFNRQIDKLIEAGIKINVGDENEAKLVGIDELNKEKTGNVKDIQNIIENFKRETNNLQNQHSNNLSRMESISNSMSAKEDKATLGIVGAFFDKGYRAQRKQMSILKKQNREIKKRIVQTYKEIRKSKKQEKKAIKELNKFEEDVVRLGKEKKYEVKFINYYNGHQKKIEKNCSDAEKIEIRKCVRSMQNDAKMENSDKTPKELYELLKDVSRGDKRKLNTRFVSPYQEVKHVQQEPQNETGEKKENEQDEREEPETRILADEKTPEQPKKEEPTTNENPTQGEPATDENPTQDEQTTEEKPKQDKPTTDEKPTQEEPTTDEQPMQDEQTTDEKPKQNKEKTFKDQLRVSSVFTERVGKHGEAIIDRQILGMTLQKFTESIGLNQNFELSPEQFVYFLGRNNEVKLSNVKEVCEKDENAVEIQKAGLEILEKVKLMMDGKQKIDLEKISSSEKAAYHVLKQYVPIQKKMEEQKQTSQYRSESETEQEQ